MAVVKRVEQQPAAGNQGEAGQQSGQANGPGSRRADARKRNERGRGM